MMKGKKGTKEVKKKTRPVLKPVDRNIYEFGSEWRNGGRYCGNCLYPLPASSDPVLCPGCGILIKNNANLPVDNNNEHEEHEQKKTGPFIPASKERKINVLKRQKDLEYVIKRQPLEFHEDLVICPKCKCKFPKKEDIKFCPDCGQRFELHSDDLLF